VSEAAQDLYAVLGVANTATPQEIQKAYYRMVRKHPPEKDAEGFQRVQAAYEVLSQPATRKEYDDTNRTDPETKALIEEGRKLLEEEDEEAVSVIKRALMRQPDSAVVRDLLTQALMITKDYDEAVRQARKVLAIDPNNPAYSARVGDVLRAQDKDGDALPYYRKAVFLERTNSQYVVKLAYLLNYLGQEADAFKLLEETIHHDGEVNFDDFIYFQALCTIYTLRERYDDLAATHRRIKELLPPDPDSKSYVAWFYYENALLMAKLGNYEGAVRSIEEAATLDDTIPGLHEMAQRLRDSRSLLNELERLRDDETIELALRMGVASLGYARTLGQSDSMKNLFEKAAELLNDALATEGVDLVAQVRALEVRYPAAAAGAQDLLSTVKELARTTPKRFIRLVCPQCGEKGRTDKPTLESLVQSGLTRSDAHTLLQVRGERGILELLTFTCQSCGTTLNGLSQRPSPVPQAAASGTPASGGGSGCFVVTAACGDEQAYPVRVLRAYRDDVMAEMPWGRAAIVIYRQIGPPLARLVASSALLRRWAFALCERLARRLDAAASGDLRQRRQG
jgi:curved DNA-binding protein CbpA